MILENTEEMTLRIFLQAWNIDSRIWKSYWMVPGRQHEKFKHRTSKECNMIVDDKKPFTLLFDDWVDGPLVPVHSVVGTLIDLTALAYAFSRATSIWTSLNRASSSTLIVVF